MSVVIEDMKRAVFSLESAPPLYGGPSLSEAVDDVSAATALFRLRSGGRCIWEILLHAAFWRREVAHALTAGAWARLVDRGPENWPDLPARADETTWQADRQLLREAETALIEALDGLDLNRWSELPVGSDDHHATWTRGQLALGLLAHDAYHIGQVMLLKQSVRTK